MECKYSPFCAEDGCFLQELVKSQARAGGYEDETLTTQEGRSNGPFFKLETWTLFVVRTLAVAHDYDCDNSEQLKDDVESITQAKHDNDPPQLIG